MLNNWKRIILFGVLSLVLSLNNTTTYALEDHDNFEHNYNLGQFHLIEGEFELAIPFFLDAIEQNPDSYEAYMGLANTLLYAQRYEDLINITTEMIEKFPTSSDSYKLRAQGLNAYNEFALSLNDLGKALEIDPGNHSVHIIYGDTYRLIGAYEDAAAAYFKGLRDVESRERTYILLGEAYELNGEYNKAMINFKKSLDMNPDSYEALIKIAAIYTRTQEYDNGIKYYELASKIQPSEELFIQVGVTYLLKEDIQSSVIAFERAIAMDEKNVDLIHSIAAEFRDCREFNLAEKYLDRGLKQEPENVELLNEYGVVKLRQRLYEEALDYFKKGFELEPENIHVIANIGTVYNRLGDNELAIKYLGDSLMIDPEFEYSISAIRDFVSELGDASVFENVVTELAEVEKADRLLFEQLVEVLISNEDFDKARKYGEQSSNYFEDYMHSLDLGSYFEEVGNMSDARYFYDLARTYASYDVNELAYMSYLLRSQGKWRQHIECDMFALEMDPMNTELMLRIAQARSNLNEYDLAKEMVERVIAIDESDYHPYIIMGEISGKNGHVRITIDSYKKAIELNPELGDMILDILGVYDINVNEVITLDGELIERSSFDSEHYATAIEEAADELILMGYADKALETYFLAAAYGSENALYEVIDFYYENGKFEGIIQATDYVVEEKLEVTNPQSLINAYRWIGSYYDYYDDTENAIAYYSMVLAIDADDSVALAALGDLYFYDSDDDRAGLDYYLKAIRSNPIDVYTMGDVAYLYYMRGDLYEACRYLDKAIEVDSNYAYAYHLNGVIFRRWNKFWTADKNFKLAIENGYNSYNNLGDMYYDADEYPEAIEFYKLSLEKDDQQAAVYKMIGKSLCGMGEHEASITYFNRSLELDPNEFYVLGDLGNAYYNLGKLESSEEFCLTSLESDPDYLFGHWQLYEIYRTQGKFDLALKHAKRAYELNSDSVYRQVDYGKALLEAGNSEEGMQCLREAQEKVVFELEEDRSIWLKSMEAYLMHFTESTNAALARFNYYMVRNSDTYALNYEYACLLSLIGDVDNALIYFEEALKRVYDDDTRYSVSLEADLDNLKSDPRFNQLLDQYFGVEE